MVFTSKPRGMTVDKNMPIPGDIKIYHIVHIDRLPSIILDGCLWCDAEIIRRSAPGTRIGMMNIKKRRLEELKLTSRPQLYVGQCVPFYFCPRSVMLYIIHQADHPALSYRDGQAPIVHLEADLLQTVAWAKEGGRSWAFTLSNAGAHYFEDRCDLSHLDEIDWAAVQARDWRQCKEGKQAEFLIERQFPWELVNRIGVISRPVRDQTLRILQTADYKPRVDVKPEWYY
nr:DUF4433 domain-containing protein [Desulfatiglans anilini]